MGANAETEPTAKTTAIAEPSPFTIVVYEDSTYVVFFMKI